MWLLHFIIWWFPFGLAASTGFSMSMRDVGITEDIHRVASSLNDIFKESFELMVGSLGKHGVYYLPEIRQSYDYQRKPSEDRKRVEFQAINGWMKYPTLKASEDMTTGALRKYKVPVVSTSREILLACVECLEISAQTVNYCFEANYDKKNVSGTIVSGPIVYKLSMQLRITQLLKNNLMSSNSIQPLCNVNVGEKIFELSERSNFKSEVRGLRTLNFLADNIDGWLKDHFNSTVKSQLERRFLTSFNKVLNKHDTCEELIAQ